MKQEQQESQEQQEIDQQEKEKEQQFDMQQEQQQEEQQQPQLHSWELHKENIQPISQGRKINFLIQALPLVTDEQARKKLLDSRKERFERDLEACCDDADKKLDLWHDYIDWLEQNVPNGGKNNGVTNAIENCIELYYDKNDFKQDKRLFNIFMRFKRFCDEPTEIFGFMHANSICTLLACFYLNWSWQYEVNRNMKRAEDLLKLGLKNLATPRELLVEAQNQLKCRIDRMIRNGELDDCPSFGGGSAVSLNSQETRDQLASNGIRAALQTLKFKVNNNKKGLGATVPVKRIGSAAVDQVNVGGLPSQTRLVNGVRVVPKKAAGSGGCGVAGSSRASKLNAPIQVFSDETNHATTTVKIPTSQRIAIVGKSGIENQPFNVGALTKRKV